jgi:CubicO group peptidase (beta-lactamase class C family)
MWIGKIGKTAPLSMADSVRIGSNTKTMTSTVIMQLVQEGKLKLDDPISKFRPDVPDGRNITIAQLATMRSGLYSYTFDHGFNATLDKDPQKAWIPDELLKIAFSHPSNGPPGKTFDYCNTNIVLLGLVIERLTGMSVRDAFQKRIFEPLKLTHTQLPAANDSSIDPHPQGYQFLSNVETINSYAVPPRNCRRSERHARAPEPDERQSVVGVDRRWRHLDGGRSCGLRESAGGRWGAAKPGDSENQPRQHRADEPQQPDRGRVRDRYRAVRPLAYRARRPDPRLLDRDGL